VDTPAALSLGEDFMLLSSAKFELSAARSALVGIDVTDRVGVDLILAVAALLPLERRVQWSERMEIPRRVLATLADGAESLAGILRGGQFFGRERLLARLPKIGPLASRAAIPALVAAVEMAESQVRQINAQARENRDYLTATLTQFKLDLERAVSARVLIKSLK
jgi:hypothetical protein